MNIENHMNQGAHQDGAERGGFTAGTSQVSEEFSDLKFSKRSRSFKLFRDILSKVIAHRSSHASDDTSQRRLDERGRDELREQRAAALVEPLRTQFLTTTNYGNLSSGPWLRTFEGTVTKLLVSADTIDSRFYPSIATHVAKASIATENQHVVLTRIDDLMKYGSLNEARDRLICEVLAALKDTERLQQIARHHNNDAVAARAIIALANGSFDRASQLHAERSIELTKKRHTCLPVAIGRHATDSEKSELFKEVAQRLEQEFANHGRYMGFCHIYAAEKQRMLSEDYGVEWLTPSRRSLGVMFD